MGRMLAVAVGAFGLIAIGILVLFWAAQRSLIYFPSRGVPEPAQVDLPRAQKVTFPTDDGLTLNGWFVPPASSPTGDVVIVFNGNAGNRAHRAILAAALAERGLATLLFDYRGYGDNPGSPSEAGLALDARAARRYLESRPDVDARRIVYFGESLGAAVAVRLAEEQHPRALILRSPFSSLVDTARYHYPFLPAGLLLRDRYPSIERIPRIGSPLLVIAAASDSIVPSEQSRRLFEAAREPKRLLIITGVDHNDDALTAGPKVIDGVVALLRSAGG